MKRNYREITIEFSDVLGWPICGQCVLIVEILLLRSGMIRRVWLNGQERRLTKDLIAVINATAQTAICRSWRIGHLLTWLTLPITLDIVEHEILNIDSTQGYQDVLWTLVVATAVSVKTKKSIQKHFPNTVEKLYLL